MGTCYLRGSTWWIGFVGQDGRWHYKSAKTTEERAARATLAAIEEQIRAGNRMAELGPVSVTEYGLKWQQLRLERRPKLWNAKKEWRAVKQYALPLQVDGTPFGRLRLADVRPRHALALIRGLRQCLNRKDKPLAPRTVANIWGTVHKLFEDAVLDELLAGNPMVLPDHERPKRVDSAGFKRGQAVFSRGEAEALISDDRIPEVSRVTYALALLGGLREGEVADRRWQDYDTAAEPLGRLSVHSSYTRANGESKGTKTDAPREVPVHPRLAAILAQWKLSGWQTAFGVKPQPDDFIVLNQDARQVSDQVVLDGLKRDLKTLGYRHRRFHDMRRTFISLARTDGAPKDVVRAITHSGAGDIVDSYTSFDWATLCAAVSKLKLGRRTLTTRRTSIST